MVTIIFTAVILIAIAIRLKSQYNDGGGDCAIYNADNSMRTYKVLIFADALFVDNLLNWLIYYRNACDSELRYLEVVCMDSSIGTLLKREDIPCSEHSFTVGGPIKDQSLNTVWYMRLLIINAMLQAGTDVILSDADAIWLRSPLPDLRRMSLLAEIVSSRAWWPFNLQEEWGACLCMGFIYVKASPLGKQMFKAMIETSSSQEEAMLKEMKRDSQFSINNTASVIKKDIKSSQHKVKRPNDQTAINEQLKKWDIRWDRFMSVEGNVDMDIGQLTLPGDSAVSHVALLPHNKYPRRCVSPSEERKATHGIVAGRQNGTLSGMESAVVAHCRLAKGDAKAKKKLQIAYGLWALPEQHPTIADTSKAVKIKGKRKKRRPIRKKPRSRGSV